MNNRGETIIEVLLAMAILGLVLAVSYATANRNLQQVQDSQERTEASLIAQNINEIITVYSRDATLAARLEPPIGSSAVVYRCINSDLSETNPNRKVVSTNAAGSHAYCSGWDNKGVFNALVEVRRTTPSPTPDVLKFEYAVKVRWNSLASGADSQAIIRQNFVRELTP